MNEEKVYAYTVVCPETKEVACVIVFGKDVDRFNQQVNDFNSNNKVWSVQVVNCVELPIQPIRDISVFNPESIS